MNNQVVAHRGWSGLAPENTLSSIRKAAEHPQIEMIEIDVQLSRDGIPVVIHDYTLERTTNGSGLVAEHTLQELKKLDVGSWFHDQYAGETIPTLEEVLQVASDHHKKLNIELKRAGDLYPDMEQRVIELTRQYALESSVVITSFNHELIQKVSRLAPEIKRGLIIYGMPVLLDQQLAATGATILSMCYPYLTSSFVLPFLEQGIEFIAWTVDDPKHMKQVAALDERIAICTNHPDRWYDLRK